MRKLILAVAVAMPTTVAAQTVELDDLWMACDLAQVDAGGDAPMATAIEQISLQERADQPDLLQIIASTPNGDALYCEIAIDVVTFRHNSETLVP